MALLDQAQTIFDALVKQGGANCYWYGAVVVANGTATLRFPEKNPAGCLPPVIQQPYDVGWEDANGSPYLGTMGPQSLPVAFTDCSGFVGWCIRQVSRTAYDSIPQQLSAITDPALRSYLEQVDRQHGQNWPSAADYAVLGLAQPSAPFQSLVVDGQLDLANVQAGDILAWALPLAEQDTGHVVLAAQAPVQSGAIWSVPVLDSSILAHANDQRPCGTGVGLGTIALQPPAGSGAWQVNFDLGTDGWHAVQYLSAMRLTVPA